MWTLGKGAVIWWVLIEGGRVVVHILCPERSGKQSDSCGVLGIQSATVLVC